MLPRGHTHGTCYSLPACHDDCAAGASKACLREGLIYETGLGVARDFDHAATIFGGLCDRGEFDACDQLANLNFFPKWAQADRTAGVARFVKACEAGASVSCVRLGGLYATDDPAKARAFDAKGFAIEQKAATPAISGPARTLR